MQLGIQHEAVNQSPGQEGGQRRGMIDTLVNMICIKHCSSIHGINESRMIPCRFLILQYSTSANYVNIMAYCEVGSLCYPREMHECALRY